MIDSTSRVLTDADLKKAEHRGYSRGYVAGKKRVRVERLAERHIKEQQAFLDKALLALLPACMDVQGWKIGDEPVSDAKQRVRLAVLFANEALNQRRVL